MDFWNQMNNGFMPHGYCLRWDGPLLTVFIAGNAGIAIAYFIIPAALRAFIGQRKDLPYPYMFKLFAAFILSCGITHIAKIWTLYEPGYWVEALIDLWTAGVSLLTAALLFPIIPQALKLRSPSELEAANKKLEELTNDLQIAKNSLEDQVKQRTAELAAATQKAQENERFFRQLFDVMPQLGWTARADGFIDFYNKRFYDFTGKSHDEIQGWNWESIHDPVYLLAVQERWQKSLKSGTAFEMKFPMRSTSGEYNWFITRISPIFDDDGKLIRWVGVNTNIQKEVEESELLERLVNERTEQLKQALNDALIANKVKTQFVSTVSHEVRTPMSGVIGLAEVLTRTKGIDGESKMIAGEIFNAAQRLLKTLNDILDFQKFESGQMKIEYREIDLRKAVNDTIETLKGTASQKDLILSAKIDDSIDATVCGDETRVIGILTNLISNAIKFTSQGSVSVNASVEDRQPDAVTVRFAVKDTGIGISADTQAKLFQPFSQADTSITRRFGGTGLGLAICKNYVDLMGGDIGIDSVPGEGATFWFIIGFPTGEKSPCRKS